MDDPMLVVEHVDKSFPQVFGTAALFKYRGRAPRRQVLFDVNLTVGRGELFGLLGPNGAGKTTLLKLLATLTVPDRGRMTIDGIDVMKHPLAASRCVGLCTSEERSFYLRLTARQNLEFFGALAGLYGKRLRRRIDEVLELVDLSGTLNTRIASFSSGMRQRITVARALLADPKVLFLDEPTRAVDPVHAYDLRKLIREDLVGRAGKTVILATNLLEEAWEICDRVAIVNGGRIVACAPPRELAGYETTRYEAMLDRVDENLVERARAIAGVRALSMRVAADGVNMQFELERHDRALGELLYTLSSNGFMLRDFRT
ncbi:MAG: ABC transporter ATP-binding protein, partial [Candidatus Eremiobacteraeota bacterium]|nr:ABC transporter ATP-binding protein [Candidatus Eremiobacteraeota bacterium]